MKRLFSCCIGLLMAWVLTVYAHAAYASDVNARFVQQAARTSLFEVEASQLAQQKAYALEVKDYAKLMLAEHEKIDAQLKRLADTKGWALPTALDGGKQTGIDRLRGKNAQEFDAQYVNDVAIEAHEEAVTLFSQAAKQTDDGDIKAFVADTLPSLQSHLNRAHHLKKILAGELVQTMPPVPQSVKLSEAQGKQPSREPEPGSPEKAAESQ